LNKVRDYRALEREYVTSQISLRELCRRHGINAHSLVVVQAQKGGWQEKREQYRAKASDAYIEHHAVNMAAREAEVRDHAIDAIHEAITKFRSDMRATKPVRQPDGTIADEPVMLITPKDVALLIDRFQVFFERPSVISEGRGVNVTSEALPIEALQEFIERTRGLAEPAPQESPLPRRLRPLID
jgi:transposase-like protein